MFYNLQSKKSKPNKKTKENETPIISLHVPFLFTGTRLNSTNTTGLDEYVDILQVQQLLLDSSAPPPSSSSVSSTAASTSSTYLSGSNNTALKCRPRVNIQKASDYSTAVAAAAAANTGIQSQGK